MKSQRSLGQLQLIPPNDKFEDLTLFPQGAIAAHEADSGIGIVRCRPPREVVVSSPLYTGEHHFFNCGSCLVRSMAPAFQAGQIKFTPWVRIPLTAQVVKYYNNYDCCQIWKQQRYPETRVRIPYCPSGGGSSSGEDAGTLSEVAGSNPAWSLRTLVAQLGERRAYCCLVRNTNHPGKGREGCG